MTKIEKKTEKKPEKLSDLLKVLPKPQGYRILIALPPEKYQSAGGVIIPDELKAREHTASITGNVLAMGPDCYMDAIKFPSGAWCKVNDWVLFRSYSGTRFKIKGQEFRILNDDTIEAVIGDPRLIERA